MAHLNLVQAVSDALMTEMAQDERVLVLGEDVGLGGGVFRATEGLYQKFGPQRAIDTPLAESAIVGTAVGMAAYGLRPVCELQFDGFMLPAFDQILSHAGRLRWRSRGRYQVPLVIRAPYGGGIRALEHHSESPEGFYAHIPGLKVVIPATPADAKGLLISAIRDPDPVVFLEPKRIYRALRQEVPEGDYTIPLGQARVARAGQDATLIAWGAQVHTALQAAELLAEQEDSSVEVLDLRTLSPLDLETIAQSVAKTGRVVITQEAPRSFGFSSELAALISERLFLHLEGPVVRVTGFDTAIPYFSMEQHYLPDAGRVVRGVLQALKS